MNSPDRHIAALLRNAGYETALFGFEHEHPAPEELGFETITAREPLPEAPDVASAFARFAAHSAEQTQSETGSNSGHRPFYAQIGFWETHRPWDRYQDVSDSDRGVFVPPYLVNNEAWREDLAGLQGVVHVVDHAMATILSALREHGLEEHTIVVFQTDHGIEFPRAKWFCYDPGIHIATVFRWPQGGISGGRRCRHALSNVDLLPTLFDLIGIDSPDDTQGVSFAESLSNAAAAAPREAVFGMFLAKDNRFVRTERYKLIRNFGALRYPDPPITSADEPPTLDVVPVELYDLDNDPNEFRNVADEPAFASIRLKLDTLLKNWLIEVDDPVLRGPTPTPAWRLAIADYANAD